LVCLMTYQTLQNMSQVVILIGGLLAVTGGFGTYWFGQKSKAEKDNANAAKAAHSGIMESDPKILLSTRDGIYPQLEFGDSDAMIVWAGPRGESVLASKGRPWLSSLQAIKFSFLPS
jgi:hypothetical protein